MTAPFFARYLERQGCELTVDGSTLRVRPAAGESLTEGERKAIKHLKPGLIRWLMGETICATCGKTPEAKNAGGSPYAANIDGLSYCLPIGNRPGCLPEGWKLEWGVIEIDGAEQRTARLIKRPPPSRA